MELLFQVGWGPHAGDLLDLLLSRPEAYAVQKVDDLLILN